MFSACQKKKELPKDPLFQEVEPAFSGLDFINQLEPDDTFNIIEYLYYYNGGGVAVGDVNNDGLPDLYFTSNEQSNALYINQGGMRFEEVTEEAGVGGSTGAWSTGVTMSDVNADGWLDIYVCQVGDYKGLQGHNQLFINKQDGTFQESAAEFGLDFQGFSTQAAFFDYDADGDLDCYLLNHSVHSADNYGTSDIRNKRDTIAGDRLLQNQGGFFKDVTTEAGIFSSRIGYGLGIAVGDLNGDACPDLYVSNDFHENDYLYYNNCDGTFRERITSSLGYSSTFSMGSDIADFDNDGRLDLISLDMKPADEYIRKRSVGADAYGIYDFKLQFGYYYQFPRNMLQWNRGTMVGLPAVSARGGQLSGEAVFSEVGHLAGVDATDWSWSPLFCDLDGDGRKDLFISNGILRRPNDLDYLKYISDKQIQSNASDAELAAQMPSGDVSNYAFRNDGVLRFTEVTQDWGLDFPGCSTGAAYADLDNDGDLDLVLNNINRQASLYENLSARKENFHYLKIRLEGASGNPFGIGARVELEAGGQTQVQELYQTRGFQSAVAPMLTFGLGTADQVDRILVRWQEGGETSMENILANQLLTISKTDKLLPGSIEEPTLPLFQYQDSMPGLNFVHRENDFVDFNNDGLLHQMLSTAGPRIAVGDVNGDGWEDLYLCGAREQLGGLFLQTDEGEFIQKEFNPGTGREELDAAFFDADGDGDLDLYLVHGGGESFILSAIRQDQLWLNDGQGTFAMSRDALPKMDADGACVVPFDFNEDGATDLFVGTRSIPGFYGLSPISYLLQNDGSGHFEEVTEQVEPALRQPGMITDATLMMEGEAQRLVIVGEWMPVTIFTIRDGHWKKTEIPYSDGWWNTVHATDLDNDGDEDLLLGNLGLNADIKASREEPAELFVKDFDDNKKIDPILTHYKQGKRYTYASLDELSTQLTVLRKRYRTYQEFAAADFEDVFPAKLLKGAIHRKAFTFASSIGWNQGNAAFELRDLPRAVQVSPLYAFATSDLNGDGVKDVLAAGNFLQSIPSLGRYSASFGHFLKGRQGPDLEVVEPARSGFMVPGASRAIEVLNTAHGQVILIARNNDSPLFFRLKKKEAF